MTTKNQIYKCEICGNIIEILHEGHDNSLYCCKKPMILLKENTVDASKEKHVPIIEKTKKGIKVKVGSIDHPMEDKHYIEWIEVLTKDQKSDKKFLKPGDKPEAEFCLNIDNVLTAREHCNLHGLWKSS
ncbi:MAG: desulfoferrodoxin [Candidatus Nanoarchaeia archaeon]|nr:desulfoferrodoxin [Candidatus Nanoarchaeia archaeon]